jgi:diketogulonate reductase-like aldo/keto reductase
MPLIGYGTFGGRDAPSKVYEAAKQALEYGYRCFDTASLCKFLLRV